MLYTNKHTLNPKAIYIPAIYKQTKERSPKTSRHTRVPDQNQHPPPIKIHGPFCTTERPK